MSATATEGSPKLVRIETTDLGVSSNRSSQLRTLAIRDSDGRLIATRELTTTLPSASGTKTRIAPRASRSVTPAAAIPSVRIRVQAAGGADFVAPAYQRWYASSDGRTMVGAGDPWAPEHPFELEIAVYRNGRQVARLSESLSVESSLSVGSDGTLALVAHPAGDRQRWFAAALDAEGVELFRHALPIGIQARDPVPTQSGLLMRTHSLFGEGVDSEILRADANGITSVLVAPSALGLIGFAGTGRALVSSPSELAWLAVDSGAVMWRRNVSIRAAAREAWTLWQAPRGASLSVLATDVQRRGMPQPPVTLMVMDATNGMLRASTVIEPHGAPGEARLVNGCSQVFVDWHETREVYAWQ